MVTKVEAYTDDTGYLHKTEEEALRSNRMKQIDKIINELYPIEAYNTDSYMRNALLWELRGGNFGRLKLLVKRLEEIK